MKVIQFSPSPAYPPSAGAKRRIHGLVSGQGANDRVDRVAMTAQGYCEAHGGPTVEIKDGYVEHRIESRLNSVLGFVTRRAPQVFMHRVFSVLSDTVLDQKLQVADIVLCEYPWAYPYLTDNAPSATPLVYSSHDFGPELHDYLRGDPVGKHLYNRIYELERTAVRDADLVVVTSERDAEKYRTEIDPDAAYHVAPTAAEKPNGVNLSTRGLTHPPTALFVGTKHWPNVKAVRDLTNIATATPEVEYVVVGNVCDEVDTDNAPSNIDFRGFVQNLDDVYDQADIALNPVTTGGGTNVKVIEYFGRGLPVISTPFGARGIPADSGTHYLVAELDEFPDAIKRLISNPDLCEGVSRNCYRLVKKVLNWEAVSTDLFDEMRALV